MIVKAADVWNWDSLRSCSVQLSGGADVWRGVTGMLLYNDLVGVVTSHVTKMAVTPFDPPWPKPQVVHKLHGSVFYTSEGIAD